MVPSIIISILILSFVLIKSADLVIVAIRRISRDTSTKTFVISALILAIGTSFPELSVSITSALEKTPNLVLGVIIGSNIANIALVAGLTGFVAGKIRVSGDYLKRDVWIALLAGILPLILIIDKVLSRVDGLILIAVYFAYATSFFRRRFIQIGREQKEESFIYRFFRKFNHIATERRRELGKLFLGIALLLFSADSIVKLSSALANFANIPIFTVGLLLLAVGTSLPEFAFSLRSVEEHEPSMFFGNLLGSTIANSTLIIGVASVLAPIEIIAVNEYFKAVVAFVVIFLVFFIFIRSKHRLDRWEALVLILLYVTFLVAEFI